MPGAGAESKKLGQQLPPHLANQKIGRYAHSPTYFNSELNVLRDELLHQFQKDNELNYLRDQVRRMESPDAAAIRE